MKNKILISLLFFSIFINLSCKKDNNNQINNTIPVACFSLDKSTYNFDDIAIVTNCSQNSTNYTWTIRNNITNFVIYTYDGDLTSVSIPSGIVVVSGTYKVTLRATNAANGFYDETTKIITISGSATTTIGTPNPGTYTKMYINKIEILGFPSLKPNTTPWDNEGPGNEYPDMFIRIFRQTTATGVTNFYDNYSDHFTNRTSSLNWNYTSNPKLINLPYNEGFKLNISLCDQDGSANSYETMSQILDIDLCSAANYNKPTLTFTQGDFSVKFTLQWQ